MQQQLFTGHIRNLKLHSLSEFGLTPWRGRFRVTQFARDIPTARTA